MLDKTKGMPSGQRPKGPLMGRIAILIPLFNRFNFIEELLSSIERQTVKNIIVVVVDHGTKDFQLKREYGYEIIILKKSSKLWFTGAVNEGLNFILQCLTDVVYVMLMNDDIVIRDHDFLRKYLAEIDDYSILSCMALGPEGELLYASLKLNKLTCRYVDIYDGLLPHEIQETKTDCDVLPTRATLFSINALKIVGLFNHSKLPQYGSDYEWTARAKKKGYRLQMLHRTCIETDFDRMKKAPTRVYGNFKVKAFWQDLLNPYKVLGLPSIYNYASLVFSGPYKYYYIFNRVMRRIGSFLFFNYILRFVNYFTKIENRC